MSQREIIFLSVADVLDLHEFSIAEYGGLRGIRDPGLLQAAVMMHQQAFSGSYLHEDIAAMAAANLFHLAKNHPFLDGNKRVAFASALTFLRVNGITMYPSQRDFADVTLAVAAGSTSKDELTRWLRERIA